MSILVRRIEHKFQEYFGTNPVLVKSPGRINIIGEHTDYNDGFVLPAAVNRAIYFAVKPNGINLYRFYAFDYDENYQTDVGYVKPCETPWANYLLGIVAQFEEDGKEIPGFDCVFGGDIPVGAGMSSSAAIETGLAYALNSIFGLGYDKLPLVKFAQTAEHEYAGVQCGIMDQFAVMFGQNHQAIKLDCRTLDYEYAPVKTDDYLFVLVNTGVKHSLASSEYNKRRSECNTGVRLLQKYYPEVRALRDATEEMIRKHKTEFPPKVFDRCLYVAQENRRVQMASGALEKDDFHTLGNLMYHSHAGLRNQYDVSCSELDFLVETARETEGVLGARMMGGGFGGCTINLVHRSKLASFKEIIANKYKTPEGEKPDIIEVEITGGASLVK